MTKTGASEPWRSTRRSLHSRRRAPLGALSLVAALMFAGAAGAAPTASVEAMPHLRQVGDGAQLIVDGKPFLMLGGELANSSASSLEHMAPIWGRMRDLGANTLVLPVSWEQIEPQPGKFDFSVTDGLLRGAREHNLKLVLLWFGSWKNSMSSYAPAWVKRDVAQFPRARTQDGEAQEILTPYAEANVAADARAFSALMRHLAEVDGAKHTVLMVQVENEMGMIPVVRDYGPQADAAFHAEVPAELIAYMTAHREDLEPGLRQAWEAHGAKTHGDWVELFGDGTQTEEYFQAWGFATYTQKVAQAGKAAYPLPFYVNAALIRPGKRPGQYPSGGPLPHLYDIWKAAMPSVDFLSPDIYFSNFEEWAARYVRPGNPLFIPEAGRAEWAQTPVNALVSVGKLHTMGFNPFSIDTMAPEKAAGLRETYADLNVLAPYVLADPTKVTAVAAPVSYDGVLNPAPQALRIGRYQLEVSFPGGPTATTLVAAPGAPGALGAPDGQSGRPPPMEARRSYGAMIIQLAENHFLIIGTGCEIRFANPPGPGLHRVGIDTIIEKKVVDGALIDGRRLNGDESNQGRIVRFDPDHLSIQDVSLYEYQ